MAKKNTLAISLAIFLALSVSARIYKNCDLARELIRIHGFSKGDIANWICLVQHESLFDTSALGRLSTDGSQDHGLFQINDRYWCSPPGPINACGMSCEALRDDDISDDVACVKKIYDVHGFNAWVAWQLYCKNRNLDKYIQGCQL